ncbi:hypothetical protein MSG28_007889 [Choristoneura fumiferana]|uniref:Uncharacterized protein n=1 Tax=Choristoneura fumiferana TaxID=7141 RepID=A0ACC0J952_CHOFU|nr:hypothetical protein MSG28_007889 [Choristoneura fumiferana]
MCFVSKRTSTNPIYWKWNIASELEQLFATHLLMPNYIKKALREKNQYKPMVREKKKTISNLTMKEVLDHIRRITRALNYNAKKNGFKVDYKFRVMDDLYP